MPQITIDEVHKADEYNIALVNFQNGYLNDKFVEQDAILLEDEKGTKTIVTHVSDLIYSGQESTEAVGKTLLLVRNRDTGKTRLIEVKNYNVKPVLKSDLDTFLNQDNSFLELGRKFGSKKSKKALEQYEKLKLNEQAVAEQMKNVSKNITVDQIDVSTIEASVTTNTDYLPFCNRDASHVKDVYLPSSLLTDSEFEQIIQETEFLDTTKFLPTIRKYIKKDTTKELIIIGLYANSLLVMSSLSAAQVAGRSYVACPQSAALNEHILKKFFTQSTGRARNRPIHYKDMAICHALVALLLISNFKFDLGELAIETKQPLKALSAKINLIGGYVVNKDGLVTALLKIPLAKPKSKKLNNTR